MDTFKDMVDYVNSGHAAQWLRDAEQRLDRRRLRFVLITILGFSCMPVRVQNKSPVSRQDGWDWWQDLHDFVNGTERLSSLFFVSNESFRFRDDVDEAIRAQIQAYVKQHYRRFIVTRR
jgi:hypothetical protein